MNYKKSSTKNKIVIKLAVFFFTVLFSSYLAVWPAFRTITNLKKDILNTKIEINEAQEQENNLDALAQNLKKIEPQVDKLNNVFITKNHELDFITTLESIATKNKIEQTINLSNFPDTNQAFTTMTLSLDAKGSFNNLMSYIVALESSDYYININSINISKGSGNSMAFSKTDEVATQRNDTILNASIKANAFFK